MSLPAAWVNALFAKLTIRYGRQWLNKWEGIDMDPVKADWAEVLGGFTGDDIAYALEHMAPDQPPTVGQFRDLCRKAPRKTPLMLVSKGSKPPAELLAKVRRAVKVAQ